ncbi:MAG: LamG-like jellyroll fold domain-containing protein [Leadbetterella sp.]
MKKIFLFLLIICTFAAQAQINDYNDLNIDVYNTIGGYSYTANLLPAGFRTSPFVVSGPSPQNDFTMVATATGGFNSFTDKIRTAAPNEPVTLIFKGNNVRKIRATFYESDINGASTSGSIFVTVTTNHGNVFTKNVAITRPILGINVVDENEYITTITCAASPNANTYTNIADIIFGDNQAQNVSLNFDGVDDYVAFPSNVGNYSGPTPFTVSCWVRPNPIQTDLANTDNDILEKWDGSGPYPFVIRYLNQNAGADAGKVRVARYDGTNNPAINSTVTINDGQWHHIAFVTTGGVGGQMNLYIDGVQQGPSITDNTGISQNTSPLFVGQRGNGVNRFKGEIDEVRIWYIAKDQATIQNEMFCKNPNIIGLLTAYNFNNGVPNGNNTYLTKIEPNVNPTNIPATGILHNFAKTGDASNWVTGQVKYVKPNGTGTNSSSWASTDISLQSALAAANCNDLFDVYVTKGTYKPHPSDINTPFIIPPGMKIYGGFAGTEKNINERNMALIHSTNKATLSGDLIGDDSPFYFFSNREDNTKTIVSINGNNVRFDGFSVKSAEEKGIYKGSVLGAKISNCRMVDNKLGLDLVDYNSVVSNCVFAGNNNGIKMLNNTTNFTNCVVANNVNSGIEQTSNTISTTSSFTNCTIVSNGLYGLFNSATIGASNTIRNTIIKDNLLDGISNPPFGVVMTNNITYSLVRFVTTGTGNLNGNTVNPQFVSPLSNTVISDAGDYRLKWCSLAIGAGDNGSISPLDLDRNPRNFGGTADMGAYEYLGNTPSQVNVSNITGTIDSPTYAGGAIQTITSDAKILAPAGAVDFKAPNAIILNPGFEARGVSKYFKAQIGVNQSCVN